MSMVMRMSTGASMMGKAPMNSLLMLSVSAGRGMGSWVKCFLWVNMTQMYRHRDKTTPGAMPASRDLVLDTLAMVA